MDKRLQRLLIYKHFNLQALGNYSTYRMHPKKVECVSLPKYQACVRLDLILQPYEQTFPVARHIINAIKPVLQNVYSSCLPKALTVNLITINALIIYVLLLFTLANLEIIVSAFTCFVLIIAELFDYVSAHVWELI